MPCGVIKRGACGRQHCSGRQNKSIGSPALPGEIHLICYETDENVLGLLRQNLAGIAEPRFS